MMDFDPHSVDLDVLVPRYLVHAYLYYRQDTNLISDSCFDSIARRLYDEWDNVNHQHKDLIEHSSLLSGANYIIFPRRIEQSAHYLLDNSTIKNKMPIKHPQISSKSLNVNALRDAIDEWSLDQGELDLHIKIPDHNKKERKHLGYSMIADPCLRSAYYSFRKIYTPEKDPRMQRLFQRGHREEFIFIDMLRKIGLKIWEVNPKTGKQFKVVDFDGHVKGSMDTIGKDVKELFIKGKKPFLIEYKTAKGSRFKELVKSGLKTWSPKYWGQVHGYMGQTKKLIGCLFCVVCKDTDELYFEWVVPSKQDFEVVQVKAEEILNADQPPSRISNKKAFWICKMCDFKDHCFSGVQSDKSCRSCKFAFPAQDGEWGCDKGNEYGNLCDQWEDCNV